MSNSTRERIYLAAMLHDIGKFYQRADTGSVRSSNYLKEHCKEEATFCPVYNGVYSHKHVLWTAQFIDDYNLKFKQLIDSDHDIPCKDTLVSLAASHHLSADALSGLGRIIKEADCLSSGMDRDTGIAFRDEQAEANWDAFKKTRMTSILETIGLDERGLNEKEQNWRCLPLAAMNLSKETFAGRERQEVDYKTLWEAFNAEFKFIQAKTYHAFTETLLSLLYKYTTSIPSSTINFPDVSLYDHLKTTAALSVCLYDVKESAENPQNPFLLIGADFSGIQSYIYQIVSKYAGKNLKGRSFFLKLLSDSVVRFLLKKLNLFQANVIYNSGGGFYLIAPNTQFVRDTLAQSEKEIEKRFFDSFGTALYVAIDCVELSKDALMHENGQNLGQVWNDLFVKRDKKKNSKFRNLIQNDYCSFFEPLMRGGDVKRDTITGEEFMADEQPKKTGNLLLKNQTYEQILLGEKLRETEVMVVSEIDIPYWRDKHPVQPAGLGFYYYFLKRKDLESMREELRASADKVSVITLNGRNGSCDFMETLNGIENIYGLEFYGGNEFGRRSFEEMCESDTFSRLGVLRMDVDNLGAIFQKGIIPKRASLSRYSSLSRSFDFFFSGYLNTIWKEVAPERSYIIYSGGDDLFIVGSWELAIDIAKRIQKDFAEYTCKNPAFGISGGIAIVPSKFPIMKGAELSQDEERRAKNHQAQGARKNSIAFLGMALNWDREFDAVEGLKNKIVGLIKSEEKLPRSFIGKILNHYENAKVREHKITAVKTFWMLTYDLSRMKSDSRTKDPDAKQLIQNCINEVCHPEGKLNGNKITTDYHPIELWAFACRWAELETR